jgi:hypothetical protein
MLRRVESAVKFPAQPFANGYMALGVWDTWRLVCPRKRSSLKESGGGEES